MTNGALHLALYCCAAGIIGSHAFASGAPSIEAQDDGSLSLQADKVLATDSQGTMDVLAELRQIKEDMDGLQARFETVSKTAIADHYDDTVVPAIQAVQDELDTAKLDTKALQTNVATLDQEQGAIARSLTELTNTFDAAWKCIKSGAKFDGTSKTCEQVAAIELCPVPQPPRNGMVLSAFGKALHSGVDKYYHGVHVVTACNDTFFVQGSTPESVCLSDGSWSPDPAKQVCAACPSNCKTCTTGTQCTECANSDYRLDGKGGCVEDVFVKVGHLRTKYPAKTAGGRADGWYAVDNNGILSISKTKQKWGLLRTGAIVKLDDPSVGIAADLGEGTVECYHKQTLGCNGNYNPIQVKSLKGVADDAKLWAFTQFSAADTGGGYRYRFGLKNKRHLEMHIYHFNWIDKQKFITHDSVRNPAGPFTGTYFTWE